MVVWGLASGGLEGGVPWGWAGILPEPEEQGEQKVKGGLLFSVGEESPLVPSGKQSQQNSERQSGSEPQSRGLHSGKAGVPVLRCSLSQPVWRVAENTAGWLF